MRQTVELNNDDRHVNKIQLAPYATKWQEARGRLTEETKAFDRTPFQRDRDRVIHSDAFRRLQYKTQVYGNLMEGDYRTRLTHSLEVAQITRDLCRSLHLDEDLGEVVALSHDLGHPPFGHAGEDALDDCMKKFGGFRHNDQTLRVVRQLESRYGSFDGLNLTWESLEGIAKHNGPMSKSEIKGVEDLYADLEPHTMCGLEAQVAAIADDLAYNHHDIDDAVQMGTFSLAEMRQVPHFNRMYEDVLAVHPNADEYRLVKETVRQLLKRQVKDLLMVSQVNLQKANPENVEEVRAMDKPLIALSDEVVAENKMLKEFMMENAYRHYETNRASFRAHRILKDLFEAFMNHRRMLPKTIQKLLPTDLNDDLNKARVVANYIASMTDRSALIEHEKLFGSMYR